MGLLEGKRRPDEFVPDPVDEARNAMMRMKEEWPKVKEQLDCTAEYSPCWECPAARAYICAIEECDKDIMERVDRENRSKR